MFFYVGIGFVLGIVSTIGFFYLFAGINDKKPKSEKTKEFYNEMRKGEFEEKK